MKAGCETVLDKDTEYAVVGYCRQVERDLYTQFIPDSIIFLLCMKYYFMSEHFAVHGININTNESRDLIKWEDNALLNMDTDDPISWRSWRPRPQNTCNGFIKIDPKNKAFTLYQWQFKILNCEQEPNGFFIGIDSYDRSQVKHDFGIQRVWSGAGGTTHYFYGFTAKQNVFSQNELSKEDEPTPLMAKFWRKGDIIDLILDTEYGELELYVNEQCRNTLYVNLSEASYYLAVRLSSAQQSIKLLSFDVE